MEITLTYDVEITEIITTEDNAILSPEGMEKLARIRKEKLRKVFDDANISNMKQFCRKKEGC